MRKPSFHRSLLVFGLLASAIASAQQPGPYQAVNASNVRTEPSINGAIVTIINQGEQVQVIGFERDNSWYQIELADGRRIIDLISYEKDVDGFHPLNIGYLTLRGRQPQFGVSRNQPQQLAADVAAGAQDNRVDLFAHAASLLPSSSATRSPSATPLASALMAGRSRRFLIWLTPTALSVAGPVTTAGSMS